MKKTHYEATKDGSIDSMNLDDVRKLIGFYEPETNDKGEEVFTVTLNDGVFYSTPTQFEAQALANQEEIKEMLWRLLHK